MDGNNRSREAVKERLARLEQEFGSVTINQTTFEVPADRYRRAVDHARDGAVEIRAVVRNDTDEVLLNEADDGWAVPRGRTRTGESPRSAAERIVSEDAAVDCTIRDVASVTITGICNGDDPAAETVYRLLVVFTGEVVDSADDDGEAVRWETEPAVATTSSAELP